MQKLPRYLLVFLNIANDGAFGLLRLLAVTCGATDDDVALQGARSESGSRGGGLWVPAS